MDFTDALVKNDKNATGRGIDRLLVPRLTWFSQGYVMKAILLGGLVLFAALAGCVDDEDPDTPGDGGGGGGGDDDNGPGGSGGGGGGDIEQTLTTWSLSDLTNCDFTVVGGSESVPCENEFDEVQVEERERPSTTGDQYICVDRADHRQPVPFEYWVFWHPIEENYGIYYEVDLPEGVTSVNGMIYQRATDTTVYWYDAGESGWIDPPNLMDGSLRITFYGHEYSTDTPALEGGDVRLYWSLQNDQPYPLQVVSASDDYYFNNVTVSEGQENHYTPKSVGLIGSDFNVTVEYTELFQQLSFGFNSGHRLGCGYN